MRRSLVWLAVMVAGCTASCIFAQAVTTAAGKEVLAVEQARTTALIHSDVAALDRIMADDATYVHASGKVDTKASYLDAIRSGRLRYLAWDPMKLNVRVMGDTAVVDGEYAVQAIDHRVQEAPLDLDIFILTVYARRDGRWQQIAWQSTRDVAKTPAH
jgi:ketosteroid isomerase-like protein